VPREPSASSLDLATRLAASAQICAVRSSRPLSPSLHEVWLETSDLAIAGVPGNDVMVLVGQHGDRGVRRRYSVRQTSPDTNSFALWITTHHDGVGADWARSAQPGDHVDVVGPRGKIVLDPLADWHLFIGDESGLSSFYRMAESIEPPGRAIFIVEIDNPDDALTTTLPEGVAPTGIFVNRDGRGPGDATGLLRGLAAFAFPPDDGAAYLFGEYATMNVLKIALLDRGLQDDAIALKAFWRAGRSNQEHGEPEKS